MSNAGDDNLESDLRVQLKLDSSQIKEDLKTVREALEETFSNENLEESLREATDREDKNETIERLRRQQEKFRQGGSMNVVDTSVATLGEVVNQIKETLHSPFGTHPFTNDTAVGRLIERAMDTIQNSNRFKLDQPFVETQKDESMVASALLKILKSQAVSSTTPDQLQGVMTSFSQAIAKLGTGVRGPTESSFHDAMKDIIAEVAQSINKTVDKEVRIDPESKKRADIFMSNILRDPENAGIRQLIVGEVKTGQAGVREMTQTMGYLRQAVRKYIEEEGRLPREGEIKGFITAPSFAQGSASEFEKDWAEFMSALTGEHLQDKIPEGPSEYLKQFPRWMSFIKTQQLSDNIMLQTLQRGNKQDVYNSIKRYMGTQEGAPLYRTLISNVNPVQDPAIKEKLDLFDGAFNIISSGITDSQGIKNELLRAGYNEELINEYIQHRGGGMDQLMSWVMGSEAPGNVAVDVPENLITTITERELSNTGKKGVALLGKRGILKTIDAYKSAVESKLNLPEGRRRGRQRVRRFNEEEQKEYASQLMGFGLWRGLNILDAMSTGEDNRENIFFQSVLSDDKSIKADVRANIMNYMLNSQSIMDKNLAIFETMGRGFMSGNYDRKAEKNWRKNLRLTSEGRSQLVMIRESENRIKGFFGDKTPEMIQSELDEAMRTGVGNVRQRILFNTPENQITLEQSNRLFEQTTSARAEILLQGVNTYGSLVTFLESITASGHDLLSMKAEDLAKDIPPEAGPILGLLGSTFAEAKTTTAKFLQLFEDEMKKRKESPENSVYDYKALIDDLKFHNEATLNQSLGTYLQVWFPLNTG